MAKRLGRILILLLSLSHLAATCRGTETGNPQNNAGAGDGCPTLTAAKTAAGDDGTLDDLILALCRRFVTCAVPITIDVCVNALNGEDGDLMTDELGQAEGTTIDELRENLISGAVISDASIAAACEEDVGTITCSEVTANVSAGDFSGVENLIPASCVDVFPAIPDSVESPSPGCP